MLTAMPLKIEHLFEVLRARLSAETVLKLNEPLARRTTLRVGGPADIYAEPASEHELAQLLQLSKELLTPVMILGRGSNLLVRDGGIRGVVVCLAAENFSRIEVKEDGRISCGAGVRLKQVSVEARRNGLGGFEFLEGIPGSVGGGASHECRRYGRRHIRSR